jgi:hypothetical protein
MKLAETDSIWRRPAKATPHGGDSGLEGSKNIGIQGRSKKFPHTIRLFPCGPNDGKTYAEADQTIGVLTAPGGIRNSAR